MTFNRARTLAGLACLVALPANAHADEPARRTIALYANALPQCSISTARPTDGPGGVSLGVIHEACNTRDGYIVTVEFSNVVGGLVEVGDEKASIGADGKAQFSCDRPRIRSAAWFARDLRVENAGEPVRVRLSILPN